LPWLKLVAVLGVGTLNVRNDVMRNISSFESHMKVLSADIIVFGVNYCSVVVLGPGQYLKNWSLIHWC